MNRAEFDKFADNYHTLHQANLALSGEAPEYFAEYKVRDLARLLRAHAPALAHGRLLDFGAGIGSSVPFLRKYFPSAHLTCVDVSTQSLAIGVARFSQEANFVAFDGDRLPFAEAAFDCIFVGCVLHHIVPVEHGRLFAELRRVLRPEGRLMVYEHNPLNPLTVRTVKSCPFDDDAVLVRAGTLSALLKANGFRNRSIRYRVFFPHALRWLRPLEDSLGWLPLGAQYYVIASR
jgi:ubiquinone/menaquinone biosynthesis C-methylase UbiE